tara:strand:+ start:336 stop:1238 length:903 start_codon:yes stop_codon:yes gene_type:complete
VYLKNKTKQIPSFFFEKEFLNNILENSDSFLEKKPFPHIIIDNFLPAEIAQLLHDEFPGPGETDWTFWGPGNVKNSGDSNIEKIGTSNEENFGPFTRHFFSQLNSQNFIQFIIKLTGRDNVVCDPFYHGGGLHSTGPGGKLMVHTDANRHPIRDKKLHQVINLILFLNQNWEEEYGGHLELWNNNATEAIEKILPIFNRCVIFETNSFSFHGQPIPLNCPKDRRRNSLAIYYYELGREYDEAYKKYQHVTKWVGTRKKDNNFFVKDWGNIFLDAYNNFKFHSRDFIPPIVLRYLNKLRKS